VSYGAPVTAAVGDFAGQVRGRLATPVDFTATDPVDAVEEGFGAVCTRAGVDRRLVTHVQLAASGSYHPRTGVIHHVAVPGWRRTGVVADLHQRLRTRIDVDNDVNLAAIAERARGAAQGADGFALLWIGESGPGLAIDLGGTLLRGARGGAGE